MIRILLVLLLLSPGAVWAQCSTFVPASSAPCTQTPLRTVIVDVNGVNTPPLAFTNLQSALNTAQIQPGDRILIKPGTYTTDGTGVCGTAFFCMMDNGTQANPIYIGAFDPANKPVIADDLWLGADNPVVGGKWVIVENLIFTSNNAQASGIRVLGSNNTIRKNTFINNLFQGMSLDSSFNVIEDNVFQDNGAQGNGIGCMGDWDSNPGTPAEWNPAHCHGIYGGVVYPLSPTSCQTPHNVHIRRNIFRHNGGSGFQMYINPTLCQDPTWGRLAHDYLIENNVFENNGLGFFIIDLAQSTIRNNTIVLRAGQYPAQTANESIGLIYHADTPTTMKFYNNLYVTDIGIPGDTTHWVVTQQFYVDRLMIFDYNAYFTQTTTRFRGNWTGGGDENFLTYPFLGQWRTISGDDANAILHNIAVTSPGFVNFAAGDYRLTTSSLARGVALQSECPAEDFDKNARTDGDCDAGAFEFSTAVIPTPPKMTGRLRFGGRAVAR